MMTGPARESPADLATIVRAVSVIMGTVVGLTFLFGFGNDPRATRYWQLVATINGWPPLPDLEPVFTWFGRALRTHLDRRH
ncbi:hypothetical protein [Amycolatopsis sp. CA-126428]|uniref:hypothetical protein n=1 Tax=Amycolatopsis sp. CA-126428 TaxID=2073158 RepID=UPI000CD27B6A|nr:hypothetical protein [Amycolatopsis sp. CA-126428]